MSIDESSSTARPSVLRLRVPIHDSGAESGGPMVFTHWLPTESDALTLCDEIFRVRIWFDESCQYGLKKMAAHEIANTVNVMASAIRFELELSDQLPFDGCELARKAHKVVVTTANRLIEYFRIEKGQYWLISIPYDPENVHSFLNVTRAEAKQASGEWSHWNPTPACIHAIGTVYTNKDGRLVTRDEWPRIGAWINAQKRPNLVLELMANAEQLLSAGHSRSALIDAVAALEVALGMFVKHPDTSKLRGIPRGFDFTRLPTLREKLGLRGSFDVLLRLVLPEDLLPAALIGQCRDAIDVRGSVVHQGQRHVDTARCRLFLRSIRETCNILRAISVE